jgi:hypothetical protein
MNIYWPVYLNLEKAVDELTFAIHVDDQQLGVYSSRITDLILRAAAEIESLAKELYKSAGGTKKGNIKFDHVALAFLISAWKLDHKKVIISSTNCFQSHRILLPFTLKEPRTGSNSGDLTFSWNNSYQNLKHDRAASIEFGSLKYLFDIMAALYLLNIYYKADVFPLGADPSGTKFPTTLGSNLFSVELIASIAHDGQGKYIEQPGFESAVYFVDWTSDSGTKWQDSRTRMQAEHTRLFLLHPKLESYLISNDPTQYTGRNLSLDVLGQDEYTRLMRQAYSAAPLYNDISYEARINKGPPASPDSGHAAGVAT